VSEAVYEAHTGEYWYKGQNLTTLVLSKLEHVIGLVAEQEGRSFDDCYPEFATSRTYQNLIDMSTLLWSESAEFIASDYRQELQTQAYRS
jgi:hypothetical protein